MEPKAFVVSVFPLILATLALPDVNVNAPLELDVGKKLCRLMTLFTEDESSDQLLMVGAVAVTVNVPVVDPDT